MNNFIFKNESGLNSNIKRYSHKNPNMPDVVLMPMLHMADNEFYDEIHWEARFCNTVLVEGSPVFEAKVIGWAMKLFSKFSKLRLVFQGDSSRPSNRSQNYKEAPVEWVKNPKTQRWEKSISVGNYHGVHCVSHWVKYVLADLDKEQANAALKGFPLWGKLLLPFVVGFAFFSFIRSTRKDLIEGLVHSDAEEYLSNPDSKFRVLEDYVKRHRDEYLCETLNLEIEATKGKPSIIGVFYGAGHMFSVHKLLRYKLGYQEAESRAVLAISNNTNHIGSLADGYGIANQRFREMMGLVFRPKIKKTNWDTERPSNVARRSATIRDYFKSKNYVVNYAHSDVGQLGVCNDKLEERSMNIKVDDLTFCRNSIVNSDYEPLENSTLTKGRVNL